MKHRHEPVVKECSSRSNDSSNHFKDDRSGNHSHHEERSKVSVQNDSSKVTPKDAVKSVQSPFPAQVSFTKN